MEKKNPDTLCGRWHDFIVRDRDNLELKGYSVDSCEDGAQALEMFGKQLYDLCILDVMLPKMDGFT